MLHDPLAIFRSNLKPFSIRGHGRWVEEICGLRPFEAEGLQRRGQKAGKDACHDNWGKMYLIRKDWLIPLWN